MKWSISFIETHILTKKSPQSQKATKIFVTCLGKKIRYKTCKLKRGSYHWSCNNQHYKASNTTAFWFVWDVTRNNTPWKEKTNQYYKFHELITVLIKPTRVYVSMTFSPGYQLLTLSFQNENYHKILCIKLVPTTMKWQTLSTTHFNINVICPVLDNLGKFFHKLLQKL